MPTALEAGTLNGHGIAGLGAALSWIEKTGMDRIRQRELSLMRRFYNGVFRIPGVTVYGDLETEKRAPVVSLNILDYDSSGVRDRYAPRRALCASDAQGAGDGGAGSCAVQFFLL